MVWTRTRPAGVQGPPHRLPASELTVSPATRQLTSDTCCTSSFTHLSSAHAVSHLSSAPKASAPKGTASKLQVQVKDIDIKFPAKFRQHKIPSIFADQF